MTPAGQWITLALLVGIAVFASVSDVWLVYHYGTNASYSRVLAHMFARYPVVLAVVIYSIGVLTGHCLLNTYAR